MFQSLFIAGAHCGPRPSSLPKKHGKMYPFALRPLRTFSRTCPRYVMVVVYLTYETTNDRFISILLLVNHSRKPFYNRVVYSHYTPTFYTHTFSHPHSLHSITHSTPTYTLAQELLRSLEIKMLGYLEFNTAIEPEVYNQYVSELRGFFGNAKGFLERTERTEWCMSLLTLLQVCSTHERALSQWIRLTHTHRHIFKHIPFLTLYLTHPPTFLLSPHLSSLTSFIHSPFFSSFSSSSLLTYRPSA